MRGNPIVHERHLSEAVRRGVIDPTQAEALLAIARIEVGGAARLPDLAWLGYLQGALVAAVAFAACLARVEDPGTPVPIERFARSLIAMLVLFALGFGLRRRRWAEVPAAVALGGATLQALVLGEVLGNDRLENGAFAGPGLALLVGLVVWRWLRAGPALAVACFGGLGLLLGTIGAQREFDTHEVRLTCFLALGLAWLVWSGMRDLHPPKTPVDGEFWTHAAGALALTAAGALAVHRNPGAALVFVPLALLVGYVGLVLRRRVLLAAAGGAILAGPTFAVATARGSDLAVGGALVASGVIVGALSHRARRALADRAEAAPPDDRSIWI